jgi:hypothetical protein
MLPLILCNNKLASCHLQHSVYVRLCSGVVVFGGGYLLPPSDYDQAAGPILPQLQLIAERVLGRRRKKKRR